MAGVVAGIATAIILVMALVWRSQVSNLTKRLKGMTAYAERNEEYRKLDNVFYEERSYNQPLAEMAVFAGVSTSETHNGLHLFRINEEVLEELTMNHSSDKPTWCSSDIAKENLRFLEIRQLNQYWDYLEKLRRKLDTQMNRDAMIDANAWKISPQLVTTPAPCNYEKIQRAWVTQYLIDKGWASEDGVTFKKRGGHGTFEVYLRGAEVVSHDERSISSTGKRCDHTLQLLLREVAYQENRKPVDVMLDIIRIKSDA